MKKNFVKKLALGLALVMTVGSVNMPVAAEAASEPGFKSTAVKVKVGQTKKYSTNHYKKWAVKKFVIGNKKVATISYSKGSKAVKVTGVAEGTTKLRADFKAYKSKREVSARIPVTVVKAEEVVTTAELASVKQTASNAFEATFTADASQTITAENFTIESADGIFSSAVKTVEWSTDGLTAKVTVFGNFVDAKVYNVTCAEKTASFTASVGKVATAVINTVQAQANIATDIEFTLYDANGIDVTEAVDVNTYVTLTVDNADANLEKVTSADLTMYNVGDVATITLTYDALDGSTPIVVTGNVTCVAAQATVASTTYFTKSASSPKVYLNSFAAVNTIYDEGTDSAFYFAALDKKGNVIEYDDYEVESSNENVISASFDTIDGKAAKINVTPEGVGTARVVITATKNDVETLYTGTVIVKAERQLTSVSLSKSSVTVSNTDQDPTYVESTTVTGLDQYGNTYSNITISPSQYGKETANLDIDKSGKDVTVAAPAVEAGSYVGEIVVTDNNHDKEFTKKFSIRVKEVKPAAADSFKVVLDTTSVDMNPEVRTLYGDVNGTVTAKLEWYKAGVFYKTVEASDAVTGINVQVIKGSKYFNNEDLSVSGNANATNTNTVATGASVTLKTAVASGSAINLVAGNGIAENGTYTVRINVTGGINNAVTDAFKKDFYRTATFSVKNTMEVPTITVDATTADAADIAEFITADVNVLKADETSIIAAYSDAKATTVATLDGSKYKVRVVEIADTFGSQEYHYFVTLSRTFTVD